MIYLRINVYHVAESHVAIVTIRNKIIIMHLIQLEGFYYEA